MAFYDQIIFSGGGGSLFVEVPSVWAIGSNSATVTHTPAFVVVDEGVLSLNQGDYSYSFPTITLAQPVTRFIESYHN